MKNTLLSILLATFTSAASAQDLSDIVQFDVLTGWRADDGSHVAGLRITLAPGWKTYWRAPGDGGIPPQITLSESQNLSSASFQWPTPEVFYQSGLRSIGYTNGVVLPLTIDPLTEGDSIALSGTLDIGVCDEICIPVSLPFSALLPAQGSRDGSIIASLMDRPVSASAAGVQSAECSVRPSEDRMTVTATIKVPGLSGREEMVIETADPMVWVSEPDVIVTAGQITATVDLVHPSGNGFALDRSAMRFTILGETRAIDIRGCTAG